VLVGVACLSWSTSTDTERHRGKVECCIGDWGGVRPADPHPVETAFRPYVWGLTKPHDECDDRAAATNWSRLHIPQVLLLILAFGASVGPRLLAQRATVTLDERLRGVRIERRRLWTRDSAVRPLARLKEAVLVRDGWSTSAKLVFEDGERLDVVPPTVGDVGHAKLVSEVNEFIRSRACASG
jgi:hypothetical protein